MERKTISPTDKGSSEISSHKDWGRTTINNNDILKLFTYLIQCYGHICSKCGEFNSYTIPNVHINAKAKLVLSAQNTGGGWSVHLDCSHDALDKTAPINNELLLTLSLLFPKPPKHNPAWIDEKTKMAAEKFLLEWWRKNKV